MQDAPVSADPIAGVNALLLEHPGCATALALRAGAIAAERLATRPESLLNLAWARRAAALAVPLAA